MKGDPPDAWHPPPYPHRHISPAILSPRSAHPPSIHQQHYPEHSAPPHRSTDATKRHDKPKRPHERDYSNERSHHTYTVGCKGKPPRPRRSAGYSFVQGGEPGVGATAEGMARGRRVWTEWEWELELGRWYLVCGR